MTVLVISDTHGKKTNLRRILEKRSNFSAVIFLGDGLGSVISVMEEYPEIPFHFVRGNCDSSLIPAETLGFIEINGKKILFTHGHLYGVKYSLSTLTEKAKSMSADILLFGHTHSKLEKYEDGLYIMNPGSLEMTRIRKNSYGIIDITEKGILLNTVEL